MTDLLQPIKNFFTALKFVARGNKWHYGWLALLLILILYGISSYIKQIDEGLIVSHMRDQVSWGFYISNFTFLVGVAAAAVLLVIPAYLYNFKPIKEIVLLGEMLALLPDDVLVVILSDHGFGPFHKFFHINNWLVEQGWLKFKRTPLSQIKRLAFKLGVTPINALKWVTRLRMGGMRKNVKRGRGGGMLRRLFLSFNDVDWSRTKAFSVGNFGQVYLNVSGQRTEGSVRPEEYEQLREDIARAAKALHDPQDGSQVVPTVYEREDVFHGLSTGRLPDLVLHTDRAKYVSFGHADFGSNKIIEPSTGQTGHHHMVGISGLKGPGVKVNLELPEASLLDLAPTILFYMGLPVPSYMDGRVLTEAFEEEFNDANPVQYKDIDLTDGALDGGVTDEEEALVLEKLRDLGYVA